MRPLFSSSWGPNGNRNEIGSSSTSDIFHDNSDISPSNLSHERVLVGVLVTTMVRVGNHIERKEPMIRLVRSRSGQEKRDIIRVMDIINHIQVGYIDGFIANSLAQLIDYGLISIQGIIPPLSARSTAHQIPCEVHIFAKMELINDVILRINCPVLGVNLILASSQQFQSSYTASILRSEAPKTVHEIFSLLEQKLSTQRVLEPLEPPRDVILTELLPHQKEGLRWLFMRENSSDLPPFWEQKGTLFVNMLTLEETYLRPEPFRGGIFADDMGMGKSLTLLSLIATDKCGPSHHSSDDEPVIWTANKFQRKQAKRLKTIGNLPTDQGSSSSGSSSSRTTLIVCPASVISAWIKELEVHVRRGSLRAYLYHGERTRNVSEFKNYDIVLTTYCIVCNEMYVEESPLKKVEWWRIILDEAHDIKNGSSLKSQAVFQLDAPRRWVVTGTPIQNDKIDIFSLVSFLRIQPLTIGKWWNQCFDFCLSVGDMDGTYRLQVLLESISLRRMKDKCLSSLPKKSIETYYVDLSEEEREVHTRMEAEAKCFVRLSTSYGEYQGTNVLGLFLRLRQSCVDISLCPSDPHHNLPPLPDARTNPELLRRMRQMMADNDEEVEFDCPICLTSPPNSSITITSCVHMFCQPCITKTLRRNNPNCPLCRRPLQLEDLFAAGSEASSSTGMSSSRISSKAKALLKLLSDSKDEDPTIKSVVFSQFKKFLVILEGTLKAAGFNVVRIDGSLTAKKRGQIIDEFGKPEGAMILLASMNVACEGINLNAASRVYMMEPWWNPGVEKQAMDRVHRIGQTREVKIIRVIARDTIEQRILMIQEKKKALAQEALQRRGAQLRTEITASDMSALVDDI